MTQIDQIIANTTTTDFDSLITAYQAVGMNEVPEAVAYAAYNEDAEPVVDLDTLIDIIASN